MKGFGPLATILCFSDDLHFSKPIKSKLWEEKFNDWTSNGSHQKSYKTLSKGMVTRRTVMLDRAYTAQHSQFKVVC